MTNTNTQTFYLATILLAASGCNPYISPCDVTQADAPSPYCSELEVLQTEAELQQNIDLCPYVTSQYQRLLYDLDSSLYQGEGCFDDVGCPDVQLACPYVVNGGETACQPKDVASCADWFRVMRESRPEDFSLADIQFHLECECRCQ